MRAVLIVSVFPGRRVVRLLENTRRAVMVAVLISMSETYALVFGGFFCLNRDICSNL